MVYISNAFVTNQNPALGYKHSINVYYSSMRTDTRKPTTIWILTTEFFPYQGGGIATYCGEMIRAAKGTGLEITIFHATQDVNRDWQEGMFDGVRVIRFNPNFVQGHLDLKGFVQTSFAFLEVIKKAVIQFGEPDAIESQDYQAISYFLIQAKLTTNFLKRTPICIAAHGAGFTTRSIAGELEYKLPEYWRDQMEKFALSAADMVWVPSVRMKALLLNELGRSDLSLIRNPYQLQEASSGNAIKPTDYKKILYIGRIQTLKGVDDLLEVMDQIYKENPNIPIKLEMIGGDSKDPRDSDTKISILKKRYPHLVNTGRVNFVGLKSHDEIKTLMKSSSFVIVPSLFETFAYTALEALANGKILVTRSGLGHSELIRHGVNGFLFDDKNQMKQIILKVLELSPTTIAKISKRAISTISSEIRTEEIVKLKLQAIKSFKNNTPIQTKSSFPSKNSDKKQKAVNVRNTKLPKTSGIVPGMLSIVIPHYNLGLYLPEAIESALGTEYSSYEIIVLDAESTNNFSILKLNELKKKYEKNTRIRFETVENLGLWYSRNEGARLAKGQFLTFLDPDDLVAPSYFSQAINVLSRYDNVAAVGCWVRYFGDSVESWITWNAEAPYLLFHNMINSASCVFDRSLFVQFGLNKQIMNHGMEDYESIVSLVEAGFSVPSIPEFLFYYRVRQNSMMKNLTLHHDLKSFENVKKIHSQIFLKNAEELSGLLMTNGSGIHHPNPMLATEFGDRASVSMETKTRVSHVSEDQVRELFLVMWHNPKYRWLIHKIYKFLRNLGILHLITRGNRS